MTFAAPRSLNRSAYALFCASTVWNRLNSGCDMPGRLRQRRNDPFDIRPAGVRGGIDIIDLANRYSCAFIQTQDIGRVFDDGSFEIEGRIDRSDIRGCNLLVQ